MKKKLGKEKQVVKDTHKFSIANTIFIFWGHSNSSVSQIQE